MPTYKLYYFKARASGELARMVFGAAGQAFEDVRFEREEWPKIKPKMPTGQVPMLEIDGQQLSQSMAITRYLAKEFGFAGKSNLDQALVDQVVDTIADMMKEFYKSVFEPDETKKAEIFKKFFDETAPKFLETLTRFLELNNNGVKFFVGDSMTIADMALHDALETLLKKNDKVLDTFKKLADNRKLVASQSPLCEYLKKREDMEV